MTLYLSLLASQLKNVEPEHKFVLVAFVQRLGLSEVVPRTVEERALLLGIPRRIVSSALAQLVSSGLLVKTTVSVAGAAGRPKHVYQIHKELKDQLCEGGADSLAHELLVNRLISSPAIRAVGPDEMEKASVGMKAAEEGGHKTLSGRKGNLSLSSRLLLATLVSRADVFGVVSHLGNVEIGRLTGLDPASLKQRLRKLTELGFIRSYVPGVSSSIFTKKAKSTYFLNLGHRQLTQVPAFQVFSHWTFEGDDYRFQHHGDMLRNDVAAAKNGTQNASTAPRTVIRFLQHQRRGVFKVIQLHLATYASYLLSIHWLDIGEHSDRIGREALHKMINADFRKPMAAASFAERGWQEVIEYFCDLVFELAEEYKSRFQQALWVHFDHLRLRILPVPDEHGYAAITLLVPRDCEQTCFVFGLGGEGDVRAFDSEAQIPIKERYLFGLLTRPKGKPSRR